MGSWPYYIGLSVQASLRKWDLRKYLKKEGDKAKQIFFLTEGAVGAKAIRPDWPVWTDAVSKEEWGGGELGENRSLGQKVGVSSTSARTMVFTLSGSGSHQWAQEWCDLLYVLEGLFWLHFWKWIAVGQKIDTVLVMRRFLQWSRQGMMWIWPRR